MNKIKYLFCAMLAVALSGCTSFDNDDLKDLVLSRVLSPTNVSAVASQLDPEVTLEWDEMSNADGYVVEAYDVDPDADETAEPVATVEVEKGSGDVATATVSDLSPLTTYYFRVKGVAANNNDSKYTTVTCTTRDEQILSIHAGNIHENSIALYWPTKKKFDTVKVLDEDGNEVSTVDVDYTKGTTVISGLTAGTEYTFQAYNGTARRGNLTQKTVDANPKGDYNVTVSTVGTSSYDCFQTILDNVAAKAAADGKSTYTFVVTIPENTSVDAYNYSATDGSPQSLKIPEGMSLIITGATDDMTSTVNFSKAINVAGNHDKIAFQKINIECGDYLLNQSAACNVGELSFNYCNIPTIGGNTLVRTQGSNAPVVGKITVKNTDIYGDCNSYYLFDLRKLGTTTSLEIENVTVANYVSKLKGICQTDQAITISVKNSTFYNATYGGNFYIDATASINLTSLTVENCIFAGSSSSTATKPFRFNGYDAGNVANNIYTSDDKVAWADYAAYATAFDGVSTDLFADPVNKDFNVIVTSVTAGDARKAPLPYAE